MQASEIRSWSDDQIQSKIEENYEELFNLRFQATIGQMKDPNVVRRLKKDIARMETVLTERRRTLREGAEE
jgi:large subunit ribosomal protein L29